MAGRVHQPVTMNDVAAHAGVSYQTVSRVINGKPYVAAETRDRVLQAIEALGYRPNKAAQSLASRRSNILGVITYGLDQYGPAQMMINIEWAAKAAGYDLIFSNLVACSYEALHSAVDAFRGWSVDGILAITPVMGDGCGMVGDLCASTPYVQIDIRKGMAIPSVLVDQAHGTRLITEHLLELGHTHICEISGPKEWFGAVARHESWVNTIQEAGLLQGPSIEGDWTAASGYHAVRNLLAQRVTMTALVAGNDQMALGAMRALREHGLRIPQDVSVVGFDDIPEAAYFETPLTTVRQDFDALGETGVHYLIERINNPDADPVQHIITPQLIRRQSTASPPR